MPENDIALELARLHILQGADFVRQLKMLAQYNIFKVVSSSNNGVPDAGIMCNMFS